MGKRGRSERRVRATSSCRLSETGGLSIAGRASPSAAPVLAAAYSGARIALLPGPPAASTKMGCLALYPHLLVCKHEKAIAHPQG